MLFLFKGYEVTKVFIADSVSNSNKVKGIIGIPLILSVGGVIALLVLSALIFLYFSNQGQEEPDIYTLESAVEWFRDKRPADNLRGCIFKESTPTRDRLKLTLCFIDSNNEPLLGKRYPTLIVKPKQLSQELSDLFGNKEMLVLQ